MYLFSFVWKYCSYQVFFDNFFFNCINVGFQYAAIVDTFFSDEARKNDEIFNVSFAIITNNYVSFIIYIFTFLSHFYIVYLFLFWFDRSVSHFICMRYSAKYNNWQNYQTNFLAYYLFVFLVRRVFFWRNIENVIYLWLLEVEDKFTKTGCLLCFNFIILEPIYMVLISHSINFQTDPIAFINDDDSWNKENPSMHELDKTVNDESIYIINYIFILIITNNRTTIARNDYILVRFYCSFCENRLIICEFEWSNCWVFFNFT